MQRVSFCTRGYAKRGKEFCGHFNTQITVGFQLEMSRYQKKNFLLIHCYLRPLPSRFTWLVCVKSLRLFHITTKAAVTSNTGNKNLATCFTTLLQNELNSDVGRGRTRNIAFQLHGFLLPVLPYLRAKFETELLSFYLVQATRGCWGGGGGTITWFEIGNKAHNSWQKLKRAIGESIS